MLNFTADKTERLDKFLAGQIAVSRTQIQKAIKQGLVAVNGQIVTEPDFTLRLGDSAVLPEFEPEILKPLKLDLPVVYENPDLAVIDKPAGLVVHPGAGHKQDTLANALLARFPGIEKIGDPHRPGIVHRLDEDTSGLILIAKTSTGFDYLKNLFLEKKVEKQYLALVHGAPSRLYGVIDEPIAKQNTHQKMKVGAGKEAVTEYSVLRTNASGQFSLLRVKLHTGRTHQIRVHLAHIGHPIVGDSLYGGNFKRPDSEFINRQWLHAYKLKLQLPDQTWLDLRSELPEDLKAVLSKIGIEHASNI